MIKAIPHLALVVVAGFALSSCASSADPAPTVTVTQDAAVPSEAQAGEPDTSGAPQATPPAPSAKNSPAPPPPEEEEAGEEGPTELDLGPGYVDTAHVYPQVLVNASTIPSGELGDYLHYVILIDAVAGPDHVGGADEHIFCAASSAGMHACVVFELGQTNVQMDVYAPHDLTLHMGASNNIDPLLGDFYFVDYIEDQPFHDNTDIAGYEIVLTYEHHIVDDGVFTSGTYVPTMFIKH